MNSPTLGNSEKTASSRYQITSVDQTDHNKHPMEYPRIHRFFEELEERNRFVSEFEESIRKPGVFVCNRKTVVSKGVCKQSTS